MSAAGEGRRTCVHCGLPLAANAEAFCCTGCFVANHLLGRDRAGESGADRLLARLVVGAFLAMGVMVFSLALYGLPAAGESETALALRGILRLGALALSTPVLVLLGGPLLDAVVALRRWASADALVLVGASAAFGASAWSTLNDGADVWFETATMILVLVTLGRWLDVRARERASVRLERLARERVPRASRLDGASEQSVAPERLAPGDRVRVRPGEEIPVDGKIVDGEALVDLASLTGEAEPRAARVGDRVLAGTRPIDGALVVETEAACGARVRDEIERTLAQAFANRPRLVLLGDRVAALLLPGVCLLALGTLAWRWRLHGFGDGALSALSVLLIACPCAFGLATPLAFWVALGEA